MLRWKFHNSCLKYFLESVKDIECVVANFLDGLVSFLWLLLKKKNTANLVA